MKTFAFTISGNHKSVTGNAVPKLKMTGNQHWTPKAKEYVQWKSHVVYSFLESLKDDVKLQREFANNVARHGKPFVIGSSDHAFMSLRIYWSNRAHGDPENIYGSVADALFFNDKNLDVFTLSSISDVRLNGKPYGRVSAKVMIFESEQEKIDYILSKFTE